VSQLPRAAFPDWIEPMAATLTQERFTGPDWTFERKIDGIRLIAFKQGADVRLYSRTRNQQYLPAIAAAIAALPVRDAILDGELPWEPGLDGFHVLDVVWLDGRDVTHLTLSERRALLAELPLRPPLHRVGELDDPEPWERARAEGWEGVMAKRRDSPYEHRRSKHWLKMKCELIEDLEVGGYTDPQGSRVGLGALLVGKRHGHELVYAGRVGTGMDTRMLLALRARLEALAAPTSPFTRATDLPRKQIHWVRPEVVVQVAFIEWTDNAKLRHPRLLAVR
jgi:bifunctional non-homologous end joining protein LigD